MTAVDEYQAWWPWLHGLEAEEFAAGALWGCVIRPPLPYVLRFDLHLVTVDAPALAVARLDGDIVGDARLAVDAIAGGAQARLTSDLAPGNRTLRAVAGLARPLARYGHDWVLDTGARQFREHALVPEP